MKRCTTCKTTRPLTDYAKNRKAPDGLSYHCRACQSQHSRVQRFKTVYGITVDDYDRMFAEQGGVCAICGDATDRRLSVDHCHKTGRVRGLLCAACNTGIGQMGDSSVRAFLAWQYLQKYELLYGWDVWYRVTVPELIAQNPDINCECPCSYPAPPTDLTPRFEEAE